MGASTTDLFGQPDQGEPAAPGSYGLPPRGVRLPAETRLGVVRLLVSDLDRSLSWYQSVLGMRVQARVGQRASLGAMDDVRELVELNERSGVRGAARRGRLGLFHFALLLPDRPALGTFVQHLATIGVAAGASDHLVSEALYLQDPDGLGIEVYADRPRQAWRRLDRELMMSTDPLDLDDVVRSAGGERWSGMPAGAVMGHVHLHVGNLDHAGAYYSDALGFDRIVWRYPGALFFSAGGYHHHLGTNTWAGAGARPSDPDEARLLEWTIELPDDGHIDALATSLADAGFRADRAENGDVLTADPWGTAIRIRAT